MLRSRTGTLTGISKASWREGRILFRLDVLERIAREKLRSLRFVDEIEVYLAYQVKLRDAPELQPVASKMRFERVSFVTEADIALARHRFGSRRRQALPTTWPHAGKLGRRC
ncbi:MULTISPECIES: NEL-type E3 ubiquitin ligase domain-containing protein [unclassified Bradyrhizobium]|uniref:NEL-type E3 ubiquitin ligase domain-containing protein n=1 Tax=unclassified Bradyrhizobium TaxID=2631580 RepID=UPI002479E80F|nr:MULTISPECIES: NEL-type E3 ubiquitin ligase domain-containing protein [unclassified Bradyrhizobium]